ncbi:hypothetical protein [Paenibacillus sp. FSL M7-1046]|uniref:hypothetical protein n=1 Tax=Paenibacillus sp. FSL M7-1046 TaxID=2975315 RepID=UPI0030FBE726
MGLYLAVVVLGALVPKGTASTSVLRWSARCMLLRAGTLSLRDALKPETARTALPTGCTKTVNPPGQLSLRDALEPEPPGQLSLRDALTTGNKTTEQFI